MPASVLGAELPAADTPALDLFDDMDARARRGEARAACRLAAELLRCRRQRGERHVSNLLESAMNQRDVGAADFEVDLLARRQDKAEQAERRCAGVGPEHWQRAIEYQRIAAERGDARMRLWYVADPAMDSQYVLDDLEEWARYRAVAWRYVQDALAEGLVEAVPVLSAIHLPDGELGSPGVRLRRPDPHQYFVYRELRALLGPIAGSPVLPPGAFDATPRPGPDVDMAQVRDDAHRLHREYFGGRVLADTGVLDGFGLGFGPGLDPAIACGEP